LEDDSLIVVNAINRVGLNWSFLENIILNIQTLLKKFLHWKVCYSPRETNIATHSLTKEWVIQRGNRIWLGCISYCIKTIVLSECSSLVSLHDMNEISTTFKKKKKKKKKKPKPILTIYHICIWFFNFFLIFFYFT
jgi:hypothetical protein